jgi:hypothetical protein
VALSFPVKICKREVEVRRGLGEFNGDCLQLLYMAFRFVVEMHICFSRDPNSNGVFRLRSAGASLRSR